MKRTFLAAAVLAAASVSAFAADIKLPSPQLDGGTSFRKALSERKATRNFTGKSLTPQQLSDLFFAASGMNRPQKLTIPTAMNVQDLQVYAALPEGLFLYEPATHTLKQVGEGDHRAEFGMQKDMFAKAAVVMIYVSDSAKMKFTKNPEDKLIYGASHAAYATQNVNLFAAAEKLGAVVIGSGKKEVAAKAFGLDSKHLIMMFQLVGVPE